MMKPARTRAAKPKSLDQQQADFTSEGSPLPGKVATTVPAVTPAEAEANLHPATTARDAPNKARGG